MIERLARGLLVALAVASLAIGMVGFAYNVSDGAAFGAIAWLSLGTVTAWLALVGARS